MNRFAAYGPYALWLSRDRLSQLRPTVGIRPTLTVGGTCSVSLEEDALFVTRDDLRFLLCLWSFFRGRHT